MEIPEAESLLHADCNEQEVICELSHYIPQGTKPDSVPAHFIASVQLEGGGVGFTLVLQTIATENEESNTASLMQSKLQLPLSQWGTLITEGIFLLNRIIGPPMNPSNEAHHYVLFLYLDVIVEFFDG